MLGGIIKIVFAAAVLLLATAYCAGSGDVVRMGTEGAYPPYNFMNDEGEVDGFERELGDELCSRANLECEWVTNDWETIIPNLLEGNYDTIMAGMSITEERDLIIDFTQPYIPPIPSVYIATEGSNDSAINGKVAAQVATIHADYLADVGVDSAVYDLVEEVIAAVLSGEVDAALLDREFAHETIAANQGKLSVVGPDVMLDLGIGIGIREDDVELKEKFDEAIKSMKADGSLNALIRKWFDDDAETF